LIDREIIEKRIDIVEENLDYLDSIKGISLKEFASSFEKVQAAKHSLQEAIEACLDIANYLIAAKGFKRCEEYSEMFEVLAENKIIENRLKKNLMEMARFRNLLVHRYSQIDNKKIFEIIRSNLSDIKAFVIAVEKLMEREQRPRFFQKARKRPV
jgi:uncharacterized protein YutE (UPF0331/DUF86 family)